MSRSRPAAQVNKNCKHSDPDKLTSFAQIRCNKDRLDFHKGSRDDHTFGTGEAAGKHAVCTLGKDHIKLNQAILPEVKNEFPAKWLHDSSVKT